MIISQRNEKGSRDGELFEDNLTAQFNPSEAFQEKGYEPLQKIFNHIIPL